MPHLKFNSTTEQQRAARVIAEHAKRADAIRADRRLTPEGKRSKLAQAYLKAKAEVDSLRAQETERTSTRRAELQRSLFGASSDPASVVAYRDAMDRVSKLNKVDEAHAALQRAEMTGDSIMARAIALHAADRGWAPVLQAYTQGDPMAQDSLAELTALTADVNDRTAQLSRSMSYSLSLPNELNGWSNQLEQLAAEDADDAA